MNKNTCRMNTITALLALHTFIGLVQFLYLCFSIEILWFKNKLYHTHHFVFSKFDMYYFQFFFCTLYLKVQLIERKSVRPCQVFQFIISSIYILLVLVYMLQIYRAALLYTCSNIVTISTYFLCCTGTKFCKLDSFVRFQFLFI